MNRNSLAIAAAKHDAILASGAIIKVESGLFLDILKKIDTPLVIRSTDKVFFREITKYLTSYKGLVFYSESDQPIVLPLKIELIEAERIWTPGS